MSESRPGGGGAGFDLVTLGESMTLFVTEPASPLRHAHAFSRSIAGAESNVAVGLARLGLKASWCGRVGGDPLGLGILDRLRAELVDVSRAIVDEGGWTGVIVRDRHHERTISVAYARRGSAGSSLRPDDVDAEWVTSARLLHVTGITPALSASAAAAVDHAVELARGAGVEVSFDINLRRRLWADEHASSALRALTSTVDVLFASPHELAALSGVPEVERGAEWALESGVGTVVVKLGAKGAVAYDRKGTIEAAGYPVVPVDPVGAGDAFAAGYLAAALTGESLPARLEQGCRISAAAVQVPGDIEGLPWGANGLFRPRPELDVER